MNFSLRIEDRKRFLFMVDVACVLLLFFVVSTILSTSNNYKLLLLVPLWMILLDGVGAYNVRFISRLKNNLRLVIGTAIFALLVYLALYILFSSLGTFLVLHFSLATITLVLMRFLYTKIFYAPQFKRKVIAFPNGSQEEIEEFLSGFPEYQIVGSSEYGVGSPPEADRVKNGKGVEVIGDRSKVLGKELVQHNGGVAQSGEIKTQGAKGEVQSESNAINATNVINALTDLDGDVDEIVVKRDDVTPEVEGVLKNNGNGDKITYFEDLYEKLTGRIHLDSLNGRENVAEIRQNGNKKVDDVLKRTFDIIGSAIGLVLYGLIMPFAAALIKLDSRGPVVYKQKRTGKDKKHYTLGKLRTMVQDAEESKAVWAQEEDPRITKVGRILRKTRLDEFMQLLNILKGEMSAVGPRPERPEFDRKLKKDIPHYDLRYAVKPGMAGWAMVNYGYIASIEDAKIRHEYDLYYIKHRSVYLDFKIFLRAVMKLALMKGR